MTQIRVIWQTFNFGNLFYFWIIYVFLAQWHQLPAWNKNGTVRDPSRVQLLHLLVAT